MAKKTKPKTFTEVYQILKDMNTQSVAATLKEHNSKELNTSGKQYFVFPHLEDNEFDTWTKVYDEIVLIIDKKSTQPKAIRDSLITMYHQVTQKTIELNGNG